jgi:hypothetical protein
MDATTYAPLTRSDEEVFIEVERAVLERRVVAEPDDLRRLGCAVQTIEDFA